MSPIAFIALALAATIGFWIGYRKGYGNAETAVKTSDQYEGLYDRERRHTGLLTQGLQDAKWSLSRIATLAETNDDEPSVLLTRILGETKNATKAITDTIHRVA